MMMMMMGIPLSIVDSDKDKDKRVAHKSFAAAHGAAEHLQANWAVRQRWRGPQWHRSC